MGYVPRSLNFGAIFKEAGLTALVLFGLSISMVGFHLESGIESLMLHTRFSTVIMVTALGFAIRCLLILMREGRKKIATICSAIGASIISIGLLSDISLLRPFGETVVDWILALFLIGIALKGIVQMQIKNNKDENLETAFSHIPKYLAPGLLVIAFVVPMLTYIQHLPFIPTVDRQLLDIGILVLTYIMLGWGLNIVVGLAGLLDLGYVAFYAVGAYSYALLETYYGASFWICLPFAGFIAASFGIILGFPVLRLRGDYLAIVTLGFGEIIRIVLLNWSQFTGGPNGISSIPRPNFFDLTYSPLDRLVFLYYLILCLALITNFFTLRIRQLPIGRAWEALREDEVACCSLGINPTNTKLTAFAIGAMFGGMAGAFFATRQGFISPESFSFIESAVIVSIVVLGGMGNQIGIVLAAIVLVGLPEFFRELHQYRMIAFGGAMVLIMLWRPKGLLAFREPTIRLHGRKSKYAHMNGVK